MEGQPGQEPWLKVPGLSLICYVTTGSRLIFLNLSQSKGIKYLLSFPLWLLGKSYERKKILGKYYPTGGMIVGAIVTQRILSTTPVFFFNTFLSTPSFFGMSSGGQAEVEKSLLQRLVYLFLTQ